MDKKIIVTIGREYGSQGHVIGEKIVQKYNISFYDKELLERAAKESGISKEIFQVVEDQRTGSFLYSIAMGAYSYANRVTAAGTVSLSDRLYMVQNDIIKKIAKEGSCVMVGRCSNYILKDEYDCADIFIYADMEDKIKYVMHSSGLDEKKAKDVINKIDKKRASYYNYYTNRKWGVRDSYDLMLNSSSLGVDGCVDIISKFIDLKYDLTDK